jgi:chorismate dehydratase
MRIGAVNYLNSKPLVYGLEALAPTVRLSFDLPSRLADSLAARRLDVALVPSVEFFRAPDCVVVSDACVACRGPVLSVKLYFRVPPGKVRRVALDEGSRTSAALTQILLAEICSVRPEWASLPIGCGMHATDADAVLLIGDRAIAGTDPQDHETFCEVWDLGERWSEWTGLPFVFAMWVAHKDANAERLDAILTAARDRGVQHFEEIASRESSLLGIREQVALDYLRDNLHFKMGAAERRGLRRFYELCVAYQLAPSGLEDAIGMRARDKVHRQ